MDLTHLHLLLNHLPTVGFGVGLTLFIGAVIRRDDALLRASLTVLAVIALLAVLVYETGVAARELIEPLPGVSARAIDAHENTALLAFVFMEITGATAWLGLWQFRRFSRPTSANVSAVLALSIVTFGLMARSAALGGEIRHPEIVSAQARGADGLDVAGTTWPNTMVIKRFVRDVKWVWPACETLHFVGLSLSFGVVLLLNLRMLGMMKTVPFADLHRLLPWGILGYGINLITGMIFFIAAAGQYTHNLAFYWKMALTMLVGMNALYFTLFDAAWMVGRNDDAPLTVKVMAASTICLWVGVLYFGRMLPYLGGSF